MTDACRVANKRLFTDIVRGARDILRHRREHPAIVGEMLGVLGPWNKNWPSPARLNAWEVRLKEEASFGAQCNRDVMELLHRLVLDLRRSTTPQQLGLRLPGHLFLLRGIATEAKVSTHWLKTRAKLFEEVRHKICA